MLEYRLIIRATDPEAVTEAAEMALRRFGDGLRSWRASRVSQAGSRETAALGLGGYEAAMDVMGSEETNG